MKNIQGSTIWMMVIAFSTCLFYLPGCTADKQAASVLSKDEAAPASQDSIQHKVSVLESPYDLSLSGMTTPLPVGKSVLLSWKITDKANGLPLQDFLTVHEKKSHLFLVSEDLTYFSHLHPQITGPGTMSVKAFFPQEGQYRLFLQFKTAKGEQTILKPLHAGQGSKRMARLIPDNDRPKIVNGYTYELKGAPTKAGKPSLFSLRITQKGKALKTIEPYLGAGAHCVILNQDASFLLHVHPLTKAGADGYYSSPLQFHTEAPSPGLYKMWIQTQIEGKLQTVDFSFQVH